MKHLYFSFVSLFLFSACAQTEITETEIQSTPKPVLEEIRLSTFLKEHAILDAKVDSVYATLSEKEIIAQLIMPAAGRLGQSEERIDFLVKNQYIGGMILLNGTKDQFKNWVTEYDSLNIQQGSLPFFYSADAEPSLVNRKIIGSKKVAKATQITSVESAKEVSKTISTDLNEIGINYNFAPVVDLSTNKTVGYRGFGANANNIVPFSKAFIEQSQEQNIIATAKHFPGHGLVTGDTHKSLQVIDGELKEVQYYPELIENGVLSIMVAHIAVKNNEKFNTNGYPATTSEAIVQGLLRDSLGFKGLVVTDAMGMGGVMKVPNSSVKAIAAGCDILLMPKNAVTAHKELTLEFQKNVDFRKKVKISVKRIIRMKLCLGLIP